MQPFMQGLQQKATIIANDPQFAGSLPDAGSGAGGNGLCGGCIARRGVARSQQHEVGPPRGG